MRGGGQSRLLSSLREVQGEGKNSGKIMNRVLSGLPSESRAFLLSTATPGIQAKVSTRGTCYVYHLINWKKFHLSSSIKPSSPQDSWVVTYGFMPVPLIPSPFLISILNLILRFSPSVLNASAVIGLHSFFQALVCLQWTKFFAGAGDKKKKKKKKGLHLS